MRIRILIVTMLILIFVQHVSGQGTCNPTLQAAIDQLGVACAGLPRNTACYGKNLVRAEFTQQQAVSVFTQPTDTVPLDILNGLRTSPLDLTRNEWGIAVMNVQANIPNTIPGQGVIFLVMGGGEITNAPETRNDAMPHAGVLLPLRYRFIRVQ